MRSLRNIKHENNIYNTLSNFQKFHFRTYKNFNDFIYNYQSSYILQDIPKIIEHSTNLVVGRNNCNSGFNFSSNLGYFTSNADSSAWHGVLSVQNVLNWKWHGFSVRTVVENSPILSSNINPNLIKTWSNFEDKMHVAQKCNSIQELVCGTVAPKVLRINSLELNFSKSIVPYSRFNLTSNSCPDYCCIVVMEQGKTFTYYIDLKVTTLSSFEQAIRGYHPFKTVSCNIYYLSDLRANHVFSPDIQLELAAMYHKACAEHISSHDALSLNLVTESRPYFQNFLIKGDVESYNAIPLNTAKFLSKVDIEKYFY